jgi:hypothetical protein
MMSSNQKFQCISSLRTTCPAQHNCLCITWRV